MTNVPMALPALLTLVSVAVIGWFSLPKLLLTISMPQVTAFNFRGGLVLTPEFMTLLIGLVIYTAAFIGEVARRHPVRA